MDWQDYAALAIVAAATFYLLHPFFKKRNASTPSCGSSCGGCGKADEPPLVALTPSSKAK